MTLQADSSLATTLHPSPNFGERCIAGGGARAAAADMLIMHYTGMKNCAKAIQWLSRRESNVSCHYVIDEDGVITQMVAEENRAWHAGRGVWGGETDINSVSIGIEIHNAGHELGYPDFPVAQMAAVEALAKDIVRRRLIPPQRVLGHSDVSPQRKGDPGEKFNWARLAKSGVGFWVEPAPVDASDKGLGLCARARGEQSRADHGRGNDNPGHDEQKSLIAETQMLLARFGYGVEQTRVFDEALQKTVLAFQRHFRPMRCDGRIDGSTIATLRKLLDSLPPDALA